MESVDMIGPPWFESAMVMKLMTVLFGGIPDPRVDRTRRYPLINIIVIAVLAVMCGAERWEEIEVWAKEWKPWLSTFLRFGRHAIPSHHMFRRVLGLLDPEAFNRCFIEWTQRIEADTQGKVVAVDGKTSCGSFKHSDKTGALHLVSAWLTENKLVLGQVATREKSNEITAIPELLRLLELAGATVTIDAMGCQKKIVAEIVAKGANYVIAVKDNQPTLCEEIETAFVTAEIADEPVPPEFVFETTEKGHGRTETRRVKVLDVEDRISVTSEWVGLQSIVMLESQRTCKGETTSEIRYYISSLVPNAALIAQCIREHWGIENGLHWRLDVGFIEDDSRIRTGNASANFSMLRRIALNFMLADRDSKDSLSMRRFKAGLGPAHLERILLAAAKAMAIPPSPHASA